MDTFTPEKSLKCPYVFILHPPFAATVDGPPPPPLSPSFFLMPLAASVKIEGVMFIADDWFSGCLQHIDLISYHRQRETERRKWLMWGTYKS